MLNRYMHPLELHAIGLLIEDMTQPVQCGRCTRIYDLGKVEITHRFLDCTEFRTPCCKQIVDSRCEDAPGWTSQIDYVRLNKEDYRYLDVW